MSDSYSTPATPPPAPGGSPVLERYGAQMEQVGADQRAAYEKSQAALAPKYSALSATMAQPRPAPPQQQPLPNAPNREDTQKDAMLFASAMAVLGAVAGRFTRVPGEAALNAFAGAVNGWREGNLEQYQSKVKEWEANTKKTIENNQQVLDKYKQVLADRKANIDEQMSQIQLISAQYHDKMMYDAAAAKNYTLVADIYQKNYEHTEKAKAAADRLHERYAADQKKLESTTAYWTSPDGVAKRTTLTPEQNQAIDKMVAGVGAKSQPRSAPAMALKKFIEEHPEATSEDIRKFQAANAGENAYQRTAGTQAARVESATNEVEQLLPQALETSRALPRGKFVPVNKLIQSWQQGTSDPAYNDFALANFSLINAYTRAMNPQGVPRITERLEQKAVGILGTATSPEAYEVQARRLWKEVQASKTAVAKTAEGREPGNVNSPMPGDSRTAAPNDGWTVKEK